MTPILKEADFNTLKNGLYLIDENFKYINGSSEFDIYLKTAMFLDIWHETEADTLRLTLKDYSTVVFSRYKRGGWRFVKCESQPSGTWNVEAHLEAMGKQPPSKIINNNLHLLGEDGMYRMRYDSPNLPQASVSNINSDKLYNDKGELIGQYASIDGKLFIRKYEPYKWHAWGEFK